MIVRFDKEKMNVQVICGILEDKKPDAKLLEVHAKVEALKVKMREFSRAILTPGLQEIDTLITEFNSKHTVITEKPEEK